jgi:Dolichyl-phosphate-mannose-protein mannosyltransferase
VIARAWFPFFQRLLRHPLFRAATQWLLPALIAAGVIARCVILAPKRLFWTDELLTWYPVSGAFGAMLAATTDTINTAPPLYFVLTWFWTFLSGNSVVAPRIFSGIAVAMALLTMFAVLRRAYGVLPSVLALAVLFADSHLLVQSAEGRFHSLFLAEAALAVLIYQRIFAHRRPPLRLLVANAVCHACMMLTSYMGLFYSTAILGAVLVSSLLLRRNSIRTCCSIVAGWLVFLPWVPVLMTHIQMTKQGWIPVPTAATLRAYFEGYLNPNFWGYARILAGFACLAAVAVMIYGGRWQRVGPRRREIPLLLLVPGLLAVPLVVYCLSRRSAGSSMFLERYLVVSLLGWAILLAHLAHRTFLMRHRPGLRKVTWALSAAQIIITSVFVGDNVRATVKMVRRYNREPMPPEILANIPGDEQVVVEHIHEFMFWHFYSPQRARFVFLVDPEVGGKEIGGLLNHAIMAALKRRFPDQFKEVMPTEEFLRTASSFYVRPYEGFLWTPTRLEHNPNFSIERKSENLLHVQRAK